MKSFENWRFVAVFVAVFVMLQGNGWAQWTGRLDELPGMTSGSDTAKNIAIIGGIAGGAVLTYFLLKKGKSDNQLEADQMKMSWNIDNPATLDPALADAVEKASKEICLPTLPSRPLMPPVAGKDHCWIFALDSSDLTERAE